MNNTPIAAIGTKVVVCLPPRDEISDGGIHIPEEATEMPVWGQVVSRGCKVPEAIQEGVTAYVPIHAGTQFHRESQTFVVLCSSKIIAIKSNA